MLHSEANVVRKRVKVRQEQVDQLLKVLGYKLIGDEQNPHDDDDHDVINVEKLSRQSGRSPTGEPVTKPLGGAVFKNIRDKDPGKNKVHEKPETRAVMGDIIKAVVHNTEYEASIKVHQGRELNMDGKPEMIEMMIKGNPDGKHDETNGNKSVIKSSDDTVKNKVHEKPETKAVMGDITDAVVRGQHQGPPGLRAQHG
jgi:uncharacterized protein YlzI (FlbEa/FlbD family)